MHSKGPGYSALGAFISRGSPTEIGRCFSSSKKWTTAAMHGTTAHGDKTRAEKASCSPASQPALLRSQIKFAEAIDSSVPFSLKTIRVPDYARFGRVKARRPFAP